jgi:hypothetical protein
MTMPQPPHTLRLRGHHLLCLFGFRGFGYSPEFVEGMSRVARTFFADEPANVMLVEGCDDICEACPHRTERGCAKQPDAGERISARDRSVLELLRLSPGGTFVNNDLRRRVLDRFAPGALHDICKGCEWLEEGWCEEGLRVRREQMRP